MAARDGFREQDEILVVGKDKPGLLGSAAGRLIDTGQPVDASPARNLGIEAAHEAAHDHMAGNLLDKNRLVLGSESFVNTPAQ